MFSLGKICKKGLHTAERNHSRFSPFFCPTISSFHILQMWFVKTWTMTSLTSTKGESVATKGQLWPWKMWDSGSDTFVIEIP